MKISLSKDNKTIKGKIRLAGSKSISNRALLISSLCRTPFAIQQIANAKDSVTLEALLDQDSGTFDTGAAGTTYRFMTARLSLKEGTQILTGSERMKQRPIGILAEALKSMGADIEYLEKEGYPPLKIGSPDFGNNHHHVQVPGNTSSQYLSALLMIAPTLPQGLTLEIIGDLVSRPYLMMTLNMMKAFGINWTEIKENTFKVPHQEYQNKDFVVEADWSAASYYYSMVALSDEADLVLEGLFENSWQGDSILPKLYADFGVNTEFIESGIRLSKNKNIQLPQNLNINFLEFPDLAQTHFVTCAALGVDCTYSGLKTLKIKETDRTDAMDTELSKLNVRLQKIDDRPEETAEYFILGTMEWDKTPEFDTYEDHRMAMALAPLAMIHEIEINEPNVVVKSYPDFWKDLESLGFNVSK